MTGGLAAWTLPNMAEIVVSKLDLADAHELAPLVAASVQDRKRGAPRAPDQYYAELLLKDRTAEIIGARLDGRLVGLRGVLRPARHHDRNAHRAARRPVRDPGRARAEDRPGADRRARRPRASGAAGARSAGWCRRSRPPPGVWPSGWRRAAAGSPIRFLCRVLSRPGFLVYQCHDLNLTGRAPCTSVSIPPCRPGRLSATPATSC